MTDLDTFIPEVLTAATGCPGFVAKRAILNAAIEFAHGTWFIQEDHATISLVEDQADYELTNPTNHKIVGIVHVLVDDEPIDGYSAAERSQIEPGWRDSDNKATEPDWYLEDIQGSTKKIWLYPLPSADKADWIKVRLALVPAKSATTIDDCYADEHFDALVAGAIARLLMIPKKEWTDLMSASVYQKIFLDHIFSERCKTMETRVGRRRAAGPVL